MREAVVVLAPDVRAEQVVERGDRAPPRDLARHLQPLRVLVEHRVDDVDERLVAVEEAVPARQQIALEPALAEVLGEDLHHATVGREAHVGRASSRRASSGRSRRTRRPGGSRPSRPARRAGSCPGSLRSRRAGTRRAPVSPRSSSFPASAPRPRSRGSPAGRARGAAAPPLACGVALIRRSPFGGRSASSGISVPFSSNSSSGS